MGGDGSLASDASMSSKAGSKESWDRLEDAARYTSGSGNTPMPRRRSKRTSIRIAPHQNRLLSQNLPSVNLTAELRRMKPKKLDHTPKRNVTDRRMMGENPNASLRKREKTWVGTLDDAQDGMLRQLFRAIDEDSSGGIDLDEFKTFVPREYRKSMSSMFKAMDDDGDGSVDEQEFIKFFHYTANQRGLSAARQMRLDFVNQVERRKETKAGYVPGIEAEEAALIPVKMEEHIKALFNMIDDDGGGTLDAEEVYSICGDKGQGLFGTLSQFSSSGTGEVNEQEFVSFFEGMAIQCGLSQVELVLRYLQKGVRKRDLEAQKRPMLSMRQIDFAKLLHHSIDRDGSGEIAAKELEICCGDRHGSMFKEMDVNGDGEVDVDEFIAFFQAKIEELGSTAVDTLLQKIMAGAKDFRERPPVPNLLSEQQKALARALFKAIDLDEGGLIEQEEMLDLCIDDQFDFSEMDVDGDGGVDVDEFLAFLQFKAEAEGVAAVDKLVQYLFQMVVSKLEGLSAEQVEECKTIYMDLTGGLQSPYPLTIERLRKICNNCAQNILDTHESWVGKTPETELSSDDFVAISSDLLSAHGQGAVKQHLAHVRKLGADSLNELGSLEMTANKIDAEERKRQRQKKAADAKAGAAVAT